MAPADTITEQHPSGRLEHRIGCELIMGRQPSSRKEQWKTLGDLDIPANSGAQHDQEVGAPGQPPYTRGIHSSMYRSRFWTMRQYAGFSSAKATNERFKLLLDRGQSGLSVAFDLPTQLGLDADDVLCEGEVGKVGVSISCLENMRQLFDGIPMDKVSTSMTINAPAMVLLAMYIAVAEEQGVDPASLRGTIQNDILKEYIARGTHIFPPDASMRLITDIFDYCSQSVPQWNTISISGYHIREAGSTAVQEVAFTLSNALAYVEAAVESGLDIDIFGPRLSFFFNCHNDFFEEVAKFRAARALWYELINERYSPSNPKSAMLRFHTQVAGVSLTAQQPLNNIARVTIQALAAVCGGTQSLHTNSYDEAIGLPTEESATVALRTQQVIAEESGVADVVDPLGGSWYVEDLTHRLKVAAKEEIRKIEEMGGAMKGIESGYQQRCIHETAYQHQNMVESGERKIIGVNHAQMAEDEPNAGQSLDPTVGIEQSELLLKLRQSRDELKCCNSIEKISKAAKGDENLFPLVIDAVKAGASLGEVINAMKSVFGTYMAPSGF
ncbi:MAG TPA: methylmalonyl-CoA mutase [Candidatus Poseidoniales archaeon]|jgi:methylmalonyl-CoA mutase N-terminal domain/subunit|nr:MAG: methylmalonyl-CoA mutase [Euryarchaeota archaeon]HIF16703.1 methylmalonyl-CoA mutase [Candidatus Poseidoniales archaeon]